MRGKEKEKAQCAAPKKLDSFLRDQRRARRRASVLREVSDKERAPLTLASPPSPRLLFATPTNLLGSIVSGLRGRLLTRPRFRVSFLASLTSSPPSLRLSFTPTSASFLRFLSLPRPLSSFFRSVSSPSAERISQLL